MGTGLLRSIVLAIVGTAIAALASLTPPMRHLELWAGDLQMRMTAAPQPGDQAIVVAIDEASLESLRPIAGQWPFDRTVFARVTDFLSSAGARAVVYDVLFADERPGDPAMAEALARSAVPVTLAAVATPFALEHAGDLGRVKGEGWRISRDDLPAREWRDVRLPRTEFGKARIGIANVVPDEDGVLRRMPMLHRIDGAVVPSLSLSALFPGDAPAVSASSGMLTVGSRRWPVDGDGQVALIVPAQPHPVPQVSFATVARAAIDRTEVAEVSRLVKGRTVFIGATALLLGDAAMTPRGRTAGVLILAQAFVGIDRGLVLESRSWLLAGVRPLQRARLANCREAGEAVFDDLAQRGDRRGRGRGRGARRGARRVVASAHPDRPDRAGHAHDLHVVFGRQDHGPPLVPSAADGRAAGGGARLGAQGSVPGPRVARAALTAHGHHRLQRHVDRRHHAQRQHALDRPDREAQRRTVALAGEQPARSGPDRRRAHGHRAGRDLGAGDPVAGPRDPRGRTAGVRVSSSRPGPRAGFHRGSGSTASVCGRLSSTSAPTP